MTVVRIVAMLLGSTLLISMQLSASSKLSPASFNELTAFLPWAAAIIAFLIVALQWRTMARLARRHAFVLSRIRLLEAEHDRHLRRTEATVPSGHDVTRSKSLCLVFVDENCNACEQLLSAPEPKLSSREGDPLVLVSAEPMSTNWIERHSGGAPVLTDSGRRLATALNVRGTPTVVRIDLMVDAMIVAEGAPAAMHAIGNEARSESVSLGSR
jgi:hypothetical protein